jgi:4-amino-4-deoxy-L-arabinose transferase-like glycosyltransferase
VKATTGNSPHHRLTASPSHLLRNLLLLSALCCALYIPGLTNQGLSNWQEAQRALVAREMQSRDEWLVPTVDGRPYLAKPPMIYWCQLAIARARATATGEFDLRLTVALAGWAGVLATYLVARRLLAGFGAIPGVSPDAASLWAAAFTATGFLYMRSSRIGELDILLAPFCTVAIGAIFEAWRSAAEQRGRALGWIILAAFAGAGAALSKGPPALLPIALAAYGGMALLRANEQREDTAPPARGAGAAIGSTLLLAACLWFNSPALPHTPREWLGLTLLTIDGALLGAALAGLANPRRFLAWFRDLSRTHPIATLGLPLIAYGGWLWLASQRLGPTVVQASFDAERQDNLRVLVTEAPVFYLEAAVYGAGLGSLCAIGALIWLIRRHVRAGPSLCTLLAWTVGCIIAFSLLSKGVPRYLTPVWPGLSILGAIWFEGLTARLPRGRWLRRFAILCTAAMGLSQLYWYAHAQHATQPEMSPRELIQELLAQPGITPDRLGSFEIDSPAIDFYAGVAVPSYLDIIPRQGLMGIGPRTIGDLREHLSRTGSDAILLIRATQPPGQDPPTARERLQESGFTLEPIPVHSRYRIDNGRTDVEPVRVSPR